MELVLDYVQQLTAGTAIEGIWMKTSAIIKAKDWSLSDLKEMGEEPMYTRAV